jgi:DNA-binding NarL/FixJ family response regulator/signal transduction histidine kinase
VIGTCIVFSRDPDRRFDSSDVTLLELFAGHAGLAMVNARMHAQAAELARAEATGLERERVVRDVHDSVARALASVVLHLGGDHPQRGPDARPAPEPARDRLDLARQAAQTALSETRRTVWGPVPQAAVPTSATATGPVAPTIEQSIQAQVAWACSTGLDIRLVVAGRPRALPTEVAEEIFTQARQAIATIVAHADARTARVGLVYGATDVVLLIQDDGVGFDAAELPRPDGSRADGSRTHGSRMGQPVPPELTETASRAAILGGTVQIDITPGWGTTIRVAIPYHSAVSTAPPRATVLVVEHRPLVRAGLLALLGQNADSVQVIGEIDGGNDALDAYRLLRPNVVLIDVALPDGAVALIGALRRADPKAAVVAVGDASSATDGRLRELVQAGARAAVMIEADAPAFARAIHAAARGEGLFTDEVLHGLYDETAEHTGTLAPTLTPRETQVRDLVSRGLPDKQIAELLHISVKTVEKHVGSALRKAGARNRTELAGMTNWGAG